MAQRLDLDQNELELIQHSVLDMENETGFERNEALADMRYTFIGGVIRASVIKSHERKVHRRSVQIDRGSV